MGAVVVAALLVTTRAESAYLQNMRAIDRARHRLSDVDRYVAPYLRADEFRRYPRRTSDAIAFTTSFAEKAAQQHLDYAVGYHDTITQTSPVTAVATPTPTPTLAATAHVDATEPSNADATASIIGPLLDIAMHVLGGGGGVDAIIDHLLGE